MNGRRLTPELWERVTEALQEVLDRQGPERDAYLEALSAEDSALGALVGELLVAHGRSGAVDRLAERLARPADVIARLSAALGERYRIEGELGQGGTATVYRAEDRKHGRPVAIKVLRPELGLILGPDRFLREIEIAAGLHHPHILPVYDSGQADGLLYYVMPLVEGESLRERLEREDRLPAEEALRIAQEVADALDYAHGRGLVHRDIKPENVLLESGHAVVADFGIARALTATAPERPTDPGLATGRERPSDPESTTGGKRPSDPESTTGGKRLTHPGSAIGTPAYMSPEQAEDRQVDGRADLYSLGCVLYEMLTGEPPFAGGGARSVLARHSLDPAPPLQSRRPETPPEIERLLERALAKAPADRFPTAEEFREAAEASIASATSRPRRLWKPRAAIATALLVASAGGWLWHERSQVGWARNVALPEAMRLLDDGKTYPAFRLLREAERHVPEDPILETLLPEFTLPVDVRTSPSGARVYVRDFFDPPDAWDLLGTTPLEGLRLPSASLVWRVSLEGFQPLVVVKPTLRGVAQFSLEPAESVPEDMVRVPGGRPAIDLFRTEGIRLDDFWIDRHEVTNREFKRFVDEGGYEHGEHWAEPVVVDGRTLTPEERRRLFRDRTGRPGPAGWELGTYPDGRADHPVGGISWYEAAAYCAWTGKELPTLYHWYQAARMDVVEAFVQYGNFAAEGPARAGGPLRLGTFGTYDMAGNVKEWAWNQANGARRYILGGGWNEPSYQYQGFDARAPADRQPTNGVRCVKYDEPPPAAQTRAVSAPFVDWREERPVGEEAFRLYRSLYEYDLTPLDPRVEAEREEREDWFVERVSFAAAYGNERVPARLLLPKNARPPFQTVVYFPGAGPYFQQSSPEGLGLLAYWTLFMVRSGRAVLFPIYKGMYERHIGSPHLPHIARDVVIFSAKDLRRAIDYLETRPDIDATRVAFFGESLGAEVGPVMTAVEPRFRASVLLGGGLLPWRHPPEIEAINFLPRVEVPTLILNGRHDFYFPLETSVRPKFELLGTPAADKRLAIFDSGHVPTERQEVMREVLDWLDRYLGPVERP